MTRPKTYFSKNNPRPKPVGYRVDSSRKQFPPHLFNKRSGNDPIPRAMEDYYKRNYRYPEGITPIYANDNQRKEEK